MYRVITTESQCHNDDRETCAKDHHRCDGARVRIKQRAHSSDQSKLNPCAQRLDLCII